MTSPRHLTELPLLHPGRPGYDDELAGFQTGFAQRPDHLRRRRVVHAGRWTRHPGPGVRVRRRPCPLAGRRHRGRAAAPHVTPESEGDLYWALLGAGHAFGVVTEMEIGLVPVRTLYGGSLAFDGRDVDPAVVLRAYEEWTRTVPDGLTSSFAAVPYPDIPALPPHLRGVRRLGAGRPHRSRR